MERKKIAVIGLGSFGKLLAVYLTQEGHEVLAIDKSQEVILEIKEAVTFVACLDATEENAMRAQGIHEMDIAVIALAEDFQTSIICADILKKLGIKDIYARYQTALHKRIFELLEVVNTFNPEEKAAKSMSEILGHSKVKSAFLVSDEYSVSEIVLPIRCIDKKISELDLRSKFSLNIVTIKRPKKDGGFKRASDKKADTILGIPLGEMVLQENDILVIFGAQKDINRFLES